MSHLELISECEIARPASPWKSIWLSVQGLVCYECILLWVTCWNCFLLQVRSGFERCFRQATALPCRGTSENSSLHFYGWEKVPLSSLINKMFYFLNMFPFSFTLFLFLWTHPSSRPLRKKPFAAITSCIGWKTISGDLKMARAR